jgi:hypothetical protein
MWVLYLASLLVLVSAQSEYPKGLCPEGKEELYLVCRNYRASTNPVYTAYTHNDVCFRGTVKSIEKLSVMVSDFLPHLMYRSGSSLF